MKKNVAWFRLRLQISFVVLLLGSLPFSLNGGIGAAEPVYDYDDFLITNFSTENASPFEVSKPKKSYLMTITQGYYNYLYTDFYRQDSLFTAHINGGYYDKLYHGIFSIGTSKNHYFQFNHYNIPHKEDLQTNFFDLHNNFQLFESYEKDLRIRLGNRFNYLLHNKNENNIDLTSFSNQTSINLHKRSSSVELKATLPQFHEWKNHHLALNYYHEREKLTSGLIGKSYLLGGGISVLKSELDDDISPFPFLFFRFNHRSRYVCNLKLEESFSEYPIKKHFVDNQLLWKSSLPSSEDNFHPIKIRQIDSKNELRMGSFHQLLYLKYTTSEHRYHYDWDEEDNSFQLYASEKDFQNATAEYSLKYKDTFIEVKGSFLDRIDFIPEYEVTFGTSLHFTLFHSIATSLAYRYNETIFNGKENIDYGTISVMYRYTDLKKLSIEAGVYYSTQDSSRLKWNDSPAVWMRFIFGTH